MFMEVLFRFINQYPLFIALAIDVASIVGSRCYVTYRQRTRSYKVYKMHVQNLVFILFTLVLQTCMIDAEDLSAYLARNGLIGFYVFIALVDLSIRIVGNDSILLGFLVFFTWRITHITWNEHLIHICSGIIVWCLLEGILSILRLALKADNPIGMGDIKLLSLTAYIFGLFQMSYIFIVMLIILLLYILFCLISRNLSTSQTIAFAPFISMSAIFCIAIGIA